MARSSARSLVLASALALSLVSLAPDARAQDLLRRVRCPDTFLLLRGDLVSPLTLVTEADLRPDSSFAEGIALGIGTFGDGSSDTKIDEATKGAITDGCGAIAPGRAGPFRPERNPFNAIVISDPGVYEVSLTGRALFHAGRELSIQAVAVTADGQDVDFLPNGSSVSENVIQFVPGVVFQRYTLSGFVNVREGERVVVAFIVVAWADLGQEPGRRLDIAIEPPNGTLKRIGDLPRSLRDLRR